MVETLKRWAKIDVWKLRKADNFCLAREGIALKGLKIGWVS